MFLLRLVPLLCPAIALAAPFVHEFPATGALEFVLRDRLDHPLYFWPQTLLNYRVRFSAGCVPSSSLVLTGPTGRVPLQFSEVVENQGCLRSAVVSFLSDLPSGGERRFRLERGTGAAAADAIKEQRKGAIVELDTGAVRVRIPLSKDSAETPGPLLQFSRGGGEWMGSSRLMAPKLRVVDMSSQRQDHGPVFTTWQVRYRFDNGGVYTATVKAVAGYDFVQLREEMAGLKPSDAVAFEFAWSGFQPTHRQAPNHPFQRPNAETGYRLYKWEHIDEQAVNTQHGVSSGMSARGELPFRLGPYQPWGAYVMLTSANFWDERANQAAGIFIDRVNGWDDEEYAIWASSNTLQVRYYYRDGLLRWEFPIVNGKRSTGIAFYDHAKDVAAMEWLAARAAKAEPHGDGIAYRANLSPMSHTMVLQNRYGTLDLDLVKDWILEYPKDARRPASPFSAGRISSANELQRRVLLHELIRDLPTQGTRQNAGFAPVPSRSIYDWYIDGYTRHASNLSEAQRSRLDAFFLLLAYTHADEDYMPLKTMLSGHPNFLSDVKSVPAQMAFLYPDHPMSQEWADEFGKFLELNTRYHTRPPVETWDAHGGRWTENLGTYVWAFLRPALRADYVLRTFGDGRNRFAITQISWIGEWLVNSLSAPFAGEEPTQYLAADGKLPRHYWGMVTAANGPRRLHPPQGAHSARRMPPRSMWLLGTLLRNYDPLTAEYMMWAARPGDQDSEEDTAAADPWSIMYRKPDNRGTNPHLTSSKYTGYGITLRAGVDTPGEVSVHLGQIDEGPNYRWGVAGEGGCGVIYYYAGGRSYSHNGREDVGDRAAHDTDFASNFGVWKNGTFRSIGRNILERPMSDLGFAQFAEIVPRRGAESYSWPEYQGRSVLMAGTDYFAVYDDVFNDSVAHRFAWFTQARDDMPSIHLVKGGIRERERLETTVSTREIKGMWRDGLGDAMAVVSHRKDLKVEAAPFGARVSTADWQDLVFRDPAGIVYAKDGVFFQGAAGLVREASDGGWQIAVFGDGSVGRKGLRMKAAGVSASAFGREPGSFQGRIASATGGTLQIDTPLLFQLYLDGAPVEGRTLTVTRGNHVWELTSDRPHPIAPHILRTENAAGSTTVHFTESAGATLYLVETSADGGNTWTEAGTTTRSPFRVTGLAEGRKLHVRVTARNAEHSSAPGPEYPVYPTSKPPEAPDGLRLVLHKDQVEATWGQVLGASGYVLYRRTADGRNWTAVCRGLERSCTDRAPGVIPAYAEPGLAAAAARNAPAVPVYEYAVAAVSGNGEGQRGASANTDPASWRNWDPKPGEPFRRRFTYNTTNYREVGREDDTARYYPK